MRCWLGETLFYEFYTVLFLSFLLFWPCITVREISISFRSLLSRGVRCVVCGMLCVVCVCVSACASLCVSLCVYLFVCLCVSRSVISCSRSVSALSALSLYSDILFSGHPDGSVQVCSHPPSSFGLSERRPDQRKPPKKTNPNVGLRL